MSLPSYFVYRQSAYEDRHFSYRKKEKKTYKTIKVRKLLQALYKINTELKCSCISRFRSAKEAEDSEALAKQRGEELPSAERFDSNCITPGTEFMTRLQAQLKYFVTFKVSTDKLWQKTKVILSGHEVHIMILGKLCKLYVVCSLLIYPVSVATKTINKSRHKEIIKTLIRHKLLKVNVKNMVILC